MGHKNADKLASTFFTVTGVFLIAGTLAGLVLFGANHVASVFLLIPGITGLVFGGLGIAFSVKRKNRISLNNWLLSYGKPVWAKVLGVEFCESIVVNNTPARRVIAEYNYMQFESAPVTNNELSTLGETVKVYLHPDDHEIYYVDLTEKDTKNIL